jgi:rhodanese-related sulfurtransferase
MLAPEITAQELVQRLQQPNPPLLLDVREQWEFETAHIDNSLLMPMGDVPSRVNEKVAALEVWAQPHWFALR